MKSPDFFNNMAAVAVVIMFAKAVTHRNRSEHAVTPKRVARIHVIGVCAAAACAAIALLATEFDLYTCWVVHLLGWGTLIVAGATLVADEVLAMRAANARPDA